MARAFMNSGHFNVGTPTSGVVHLDAGVQYAYARVGKFVSAMCETNLDVPLEDVEAGYTREAYTVAWFVDGPATCIECLAAEARRGRWVR